MHRTSEPVCWVCKQHSPHSHHPIFHPHLRVLHHTNCWSEYLIPFNTVKRMLRRLAASQMYVLWLNNTVGAPTLWRCLWNLSYVLLPSPIITIVSLGVTLFLKKNSNRLSFACCFWLRKINLLKMIQHSWHTQRAPFNKTRLRDLLVSKLNVGCL